MSNPKEEEIIELLERVLKFIFHYDLGYKDITKEEGEALVDDIKTLLYKMKND